MWFGIGIFIITDMAVIEKIKNLFLNILFSPLCLSCRANLEDEEKQNGICSKCLDRIILNTSIFCPICKARLPDGRKTCHKDSSFLLAAAGNYENDAIRNLIWHFKYQKWQKLSVVLGKFLTEYLKTINYNLNNYIIAPIPLYKSRLRERGFNQAELLAKIVAENLGLELTNNCFKRIKDTKIQAELKDSEERKLNVKNCFAVEKPELIKSKNIILVDDVFTSGATMNEAVEVLKSAGAKRIIALVAAKAG